MIDGLVVVDKPAGMTSHDVVGRCRRVFGQKRIGHAGTLDPDATGVLLVGLGAATRLLRFLSDQPKRYTGEVVLGVATSTLDASGEVVGRWDMGGVTVEAVRAAAAALTGDIDQVPPMVSAVQVGGRRLHELAREGIEVERAPRSVRVDAFDVEPRAEGVFAIDVTCSAGTYIRVLAADIGAALGGGAHLRNLRRVASGGYTEADAVALDDVGESHVLPPVAAVRDMPSVTVGAEIAAAIAHGKVLDAADLAMTDDVDTPQSVLDGAGTLLAVYERHATKPGKVKPAVVLA